MMNKPERDFEGFRFLANSGNWFLVIDSCSNLYIIDVFGKNLIDLLPLESRALVQNILNKIAIGKQSKTFRVFKKDPNPYPNQYYIEVNFLAGVALLHGLRITVPGIEPNSIYFIIHDSPCYRLRKTLIMDICVFNIATKTLKRFPSLSNMKLKVARWFLPVPPAT
ncbi:hypothetical protein ARALYDRAFT_899647 [Arabidopsis lyrata subsp. lyrata]|uniref:DUF295 domain-containing protein n=1 Tax=Arabidopsis lyrata subsp. lyrata TaxID=81972 RepID=D7L1S6_ARALL|nr:hypothetical protein ARALYDRAFT_899647 [Arabidopsis lyrata subsp. lyrata]